MLLIVGILIVFAATLGGFMIAGGHPGVLLHLSEFVTSRHFRGQNPS
jgi:flagellar motor component MotA